MWMIIIKAQMIESKQAVQVSHPHIQYAPSPYTIRNKYTTQPLSISSGLFSLAVPHILWSHGKQAHLHPH